MYSVAAICTYKRIVAFALELLHGCFDICCTAGTNKHLRVVQGGSGAL